MKIKLVNLERDLFKVSAATARTTLDCSFDELHAIAKAEIERLEKEVERLEIYKDAYYAYMKAR